MKTRAIFITILSLATVAGLTSCSEKTPAAANQPSSSKEQTFIATFRQALENKDSKAMDTLLLKEGTPTEVLEFFTMMLEIPEGMKIESLELITPSAEEVAKYQQAMAMPDGKNYKLPITPTKQLVMIMKEAAANAGGTSKSSLPVAEKDGKLIIPLPIPAP